jgi:DNA-binding NtrC family response regulator
MSEPEHKPSVFIIDDERNTREGLARALRGKYDVRLAESAVAALPLLEQAPADVVLTDLRMPGMDGMSFIRRLTAQPDPPIIIMLTAYGTVQTAVEAMKVGAYDYLAKPVNLDNLEMLIERGLESRRLRSENEALRRQLDKRYGLDGLVGRSPAMATVFDTIRQAAPARSTVLITGESGTGKELVAHILHRLSPRAAGPFVAVHCAALNSNLLESELFGHEKGAFTGAVGRQLGRFEKADGGTLFLDEIGDIDPAIQVTLLRVLETRSFERVGGSAPVEVDVRLITATNRDLKAQVAAGKFREDLYYRLDVVHVHLPPLRERTEDIPFLLDHFLRISAAENGKTIGGFTPEAVKVLTAYAWPGNVRELRNAVERMVVMGRGGTLALGDVPPEIRAGIAEALARAPAPAAPAPDGRPAAATDALDLTAQERGLVIRALRECQGNRSLAARRLGIGRRTLYRKLAAYGLEGL